MNNWYHKNTFKNFLFNLEKPAFCGHFGDPGRAKPHTCKAMVIQVSFIDIQLSYRCEVSWVLIFVCYNFCHLANISSLLSDNIFSFLIKRYYNNQTS